MRDVLRTNDREKAIAHDDRSADDGSMDWRCGFENLSREHGFLELRVDGELPSELRGTFYRNGPGNFDVGGRRYQHWFDGDGTITAVRLDGRGGAQGAVKLVATPWRERERRAGKPLFGGYDTPAPRPIRQLLFSDVKNPINTSVMLHNGRLYATCEAGKPFEISVEDLSTIGATNLGGVVTRAFSAHPHRVPSRATTYGFGLTTGKETKVECFALPDGHRAQRLGSTFAIEGQRMNHDFAVTDRHLVFFFAPVYFSLWSTLRGRPLVSSSKYLPERGTEIVVVPLDQPSKLVRFTAPAFFMEHVVNAYELGGGDIVIDYLHYDDLRGFEDWFGGIANGSSKRLASSFRRAFVNPNARTFRSELVLDEPIELPRISPLFEAAKHRFTYALAFDHAKAPPTAILKHDVETNGVERYAPGSGQYPSEPLFVPRHGGRREDDGWLITLVLDAKKGTTQREALDAQRLDEGPVASARFDQPLPFGFHGIWAPAR